MRAPAPFLRATALLCTVASVALPPNTQLAGAQGRFPRIELLEAGDLGGEPRRPALAGGVWAGDPLILNVEPELDRTFLFRLGWLAPDPETDVPANSGTVAGDTPVLPLPREFGAEAPDLRGTAEPPASPGGQLPPPAEVAPANGRPIGPQGGPAVPSLPEILAFPPLPPGVLEVAVGGNGTDSLVAWAAQEGPAEAPSIRLSARRLGPDGSPGSGGDVTLQIGPSRPADLAVAMGPDGEAIVAWTNHLAGRGAGLRWRAISRADGLGPLKTGWDIGSDQGSPSVAAIPGGFALAHLRTTLQGEPPGEERAIGKAADASDDADVAPDAPLPMREILLRRLGPSGGNPRGAPAVAAARKGLGHPSVAVRGSTVTLFWTDPRGGGRLLRSRTFGTDGSPLGTEGTLRTDLRIGDAAPYRVSPAGEGYWLIVWPQLEGRGRSMVLEARLFHASGNAAGPPLLVARSPGAIGLRDLIQSRTADRWIALWTEEEAGQYHLRYRPLRREPKG